MRPANPATSAAKKRAADSTRERQRRYEATDRGRQMARERFKRYKQRLREGVDIDGEPA